MLDTKSIIDNGYNKTEFGMERTENTAISVDPSAADLYEETTTEDPVGIILRDELNDLMYSEFEKSPWYEKYNKKDKSVERNDLQDVYYYFKPILVDKGKCNEMEAFMCICEFFALDYKKMYNDVISIEGKAKILTVLKEKYGLSKELGGINRLI